MAVKEIQMWDIKRVKPYDKNPRLNDDAVDSVANSIKEFGFKSPIIVDKEGVIVCGHTRLKTSKKLKLKEVPVIVADDLTDEQIKAYRLADNKTGELASWDIETLDEELNEITDIDMSDFGFELDGISEGCIDGDGERKMSLSDKFIVPPFSILNSEAGYWKDRKSNWLDIGIFSEKGRKENLISSSKEGYSHVKGGETAVHTSVFDPVLAEVCYKWFCIENGKITDCFAGGSVRGIVAEKLGYSYTGLDISQIQIDENNKQAETIGVKPVWICDDSKNILNHVNENSQDMIFTCPPYFDLEKYSDDKNDISNMPFDDFVSAYTEILSRTIKTLKDNRFAVIVIGDVRDKNGFYRDLIGITKTICLKAGLNLYNELIYKEPEGSAIFRAGKIFNAMRKVVKIHQNVLVFYKGKNQQNIKKDFLAFNDDYTKYEGLE